MNIVKKTYTMSRRNNMKQDCYIIGFYIYGLLKKESEGRKKKDLA